MSIIMFQSRPDYALLSFLPWAFGYFCGQRFR